MIGEELRTEEVVAVVVVHAEREQRFAAAAVGLGQHDGVRIDAGIEKRLQIFESLLLGGRPVRALFRGR